MNESLHQLPQVPNPDSAYAGSTDILKLRNRVQAAVLKEMTGATIIKEKDISPEEIHLQESWGIRYGGIFSDLFKKDTEFKRAVLREDIEEVIRLLKAEELRLAGGTEAH